MPFNQELPQWNAVGDKPPQSKLDSGWQIGERPPAGWWNWLLNRTHKAIEELQNEAINIDQKGVANGVATLGADGKVPASQLNVTAPADASTTVKGIVMLEDSVSSTSTTKAATPNSVRQVNTSLTNHVGDTAIHVSSADRTNWNSKVNGTHTHAIADVTGLQTALDGKASTSHSHANATPSAAGFMSSTDKSKLDGIEAKIDGAKDELSAQIGILSGLNTTAKDNLVNAGNELFTFANDGKTKWSSVIGSPLVSSDTFTQMQTKTQTIKDTLATNLTAKGQASVGTETLTALVNKVANVATGKKFAQGTASIPSSGGKLIVNNLDFAPSVVFLQYYKSESGSNYKEVMSTFRKTGSNPVNIGVSLPYGSSGSVGSGATINERTDQFENGLYSNGFVRYLGSNSGSYTVYWYAWE